MLRARFLAVCLLPLPLDTSCQVVMFLGAAETTTTTIQRGGVAAMPTIQPSSSSGDLLTMPARLPAGAVLMGAPSANAPMSLQVGPLPDAFLTQKSD